MRYKFTIFLLGLNIIAFGLIIYLSKQSGQLGDSPGGLSGQIGRELIEADKIEIRGRGLSEPQILQRNGSGWKIIKPMQWSANYFAVSKILNQLQFIEEEATFSIDEIRRTGQTLADYGLEDPIIELIIYEGDEAFPIRIGTLTEIGNNVYLLGPDRKQIFVVGREIIEGLIVNLDDLRTREIFSIPVFEVQELSLQIRSSVAGNNGDLKVRLANTAGKWSFEAPLTAEADPALVSNTINNLAAVKVGRFLEPGSGDPVLQGLENPFMRVTLHGNKRRQTLFIGNQDPSSPVSQPQYFARLQDNSAVFTVDAKPFEELLEAQEALRERNFISFDKDELNAIYIEENGRQIRLQKIEPKVWQVIESFGEGEVKPRRADTQILEDLIAELQQLRAKNFALDAPTTVDLERLGFNAPRRTVTLDFDEGSNLTLELAHPEDENLKLYARTGEKEFIYEVERRPNLRQLPLNGLHYRNRILETLPQGALVQSVKLTNLSTQEPLFEYTLQEDQSWKDILEKEDAAQAKALSTILLAIRRFKVETYLFDEYKNVYPIETDRSLPWAYQLDAQIIFPGADDVQIRQSSFVFTERLSGATQVGGSKTQDTIFGLTQELIDALYTWTNTMTPPPEASGKEISAPASIEPVPEPAAPPEAE